MTVDIYETINNNIYNFPKKLPYITVSSKGISNGLSTIINDGADFGPDTYLNTSSKNRYGPPYTQTSGIQEAINYAVANNRSILLRNGIYYVTAPFQVCEADPSYQAQIILPPTNGTQHLTITTESPIQLGIPNGPMTTTGAIIYSKPSSYPNAVLPPWPFVMFVSPTYDLQIDILIRQAGTTQQVNGIYLYGAYTFSGNIRVDIDATMDSGAPSTAPSGLSTQPIATAIQTPNESYGEGHNFLNISVFGYKQGILLESQTEIGNAYFSYVFAPLQIASTLHPKTIWYLNSNNCTHLFNLGVTGNGYSEIYCNLADIQDNLNTNEWFKTVDHIYYGNPIINGEFVGTAASGIIRGIRNPQGSLIPYNAPLIIGGNLNGAPSYLQILTSHSQQSTTNGSTAGTVLMTAVEYRTEYKKYVITFNDYENNTTTNQTINYPLPFSSYAFITGNNTGLTISASTTGITITAPNSTTTYNGIVIVEGY